MRRSYKSAFIRVLPLAWRGAAQLCEADSARPVPPRPFLRLSHRASAVLVAFVLGFGGSVGPLGLLLRDSVHVCTCSLTDHDCDCPHCSGMHVVAPAEQEPVLAFHAVPCGEETGARGDLLFTQAMLLPARPKTPSAQASLIVHRHRPPSALPSRPGRAPEPPPPRAG